MDKYYKNHGAPWTESLNNRLLTDYRLFCVDQAARHNRSQRAIDFQLRRLLNVNKQEKEQEMDQIDKSDLVSCVELEMLKRQAELQAAKDSKMLRSRARIAALTDAQLLDLAYTCLPAGHRGLLVEVLSIDEVFRSKKLSTKMANQLHYLKRVYLKTIRDSISNEADQSEVIFWLYINKQE